MLKQRAASPPSPSYAAPSYAEPGGASRRAAAAAPAAKPPRPGKNYTQPARRVGQGTRRFGQAFFGPMMHVSGTLWLEITGLFFALFALFFAQNVMRLRFAYAHGPEHTHFVLYVILMLLFCWFSISSFLKARRRSKRRAR
ncbi:MAG: hypothetical protein ACR2JE_14360 [Acidobacteriaceae bacterium]